MTVTRERVEEIRKFHADRREGDCTILLAFIDEQAEDISRIDKWRKTWRSLAEDLRRASVRQATALLILKQRDDLAEQVNQLTAERDFLSNSRAEHMELHQRSIDLKEKYVTEIRDLKGTIAHLQTEDSIRISGLEQERDRLAARVERLESDLQKLCKALARDDEEKGK